MIQFTSDIEYWFNEDSFNQQDHQNIAIISFIIISTAGIGGVLCFSEKRRIAWCISLLNSFFLMISGFVYTIYLITKYPGLLHFEPNIDMFYGSCNYGTITFIFFIIANVLDLLFGFMFYYEKMDVLTSFIHHPVFIWMTYFAWTGNGFFTSGPPFAPAFMFLYTVETPTFLLALGSVFPSCRTDIGFGVTFLLFRILAHLYMGLLAYASGIELPLKLCYFFPFLLHIFWFTTWCLKYGKKLQNKEIKHL